MSLRLHTRYALLFILLLAAAALSAACATEETNQNNKIEFTEPLTLEEFITRNNKLIERAYCQRVFECPEKQPPRTVQHLGRFQDQQACHAGIATVLALNSFDEQRTSVEAGRLAFDPQQAQKCLDKLSQQTSTCRSILELHDPANTCDDIFIPQQALNEPCERDWECPTNHCQPVRGQCYGTCAPPRKRVGVGETCILDAICADGLLCVTEMREPRPQYTICVEPHSRGKGELCNGQDDWCEKGLVCGRESTCTEPPTSAASGEPCDLYTTICQLGLACTDLTPTQNGQTATGTCQPIRTTDQPCQITEQCPMGLYCDANGPDTGHCRPPKAIGQPCSDYRYDECITGSYCFTWDPYPAEPTCGTHTDKTCDVPTH